MKKNIWLIAGGLAALGLGLVALPGRSSTLQDQYDSARLAQEEAARSLALAQSELQKVQALPGQEFDRGQEFDKVTVLVDDEGPSWLGVETHEVTSGNAKELKLPAERGVVVGRITPDSPAAKAGLKEKDVITEVNGQRVEGSAQFRRMIHEVPAGRTVQMTVWRDVRAQTLSVTLGKAEEGHRGWMNAGPGAFAFRMPEVEIPEMPQMDWSNGIGMFPGVHPRLGIDAEDVSGQLGAYFGAPDSEGVLVRNVNPGSAAEKAGVKAGDVITSFNGERIRSLGDLRERLAGKNEDQSAKLGVLRNRSEITLTVELPTAKQKTARMTHSTNI
jgi:membrane-associated protease RseP (regulator of RpoE activity)